MGIKIPSIFEKLIDKLDIDSRIEVNRDETGNRKIYLKGFKVKGSNNNVSLGVTINENATGVPYSPKISKELIDAYRKDGYIFSRYDIMKPIAEESLGLGDYQDIIDRMQPYLLPQRPKHFGALKYAATTCKLEDEGVAKKEIEERKKHLTMFFVGIQTGTTFYNWIRCKDSVFEADIFPYLELLETIFPQKEASRREKFFPFWDSMLQFHPTRIFVHSYMNKEELTGSIYTRAWDNQADPIMVYARAGRVKFVKSYIKSEDLNTDFRINESKYKLGNSKASTFLFKKNK